MLLTLGTEFRPQIQNEMGTFYFTVRLSQVLDTMVPGTLIKENILLGF